MTTSNIEQQIEATLSSLDGVERADVSPYFYSRLQQRMTKEKSSFFQVPMMVFARPIISIAALFIFLVLNGVAISSLWQQKQQQAKQSSASLKNFAKEYDLNISTAYEQ